VRERCHLQQRHNIKGCGRTFEAAPRINPITVFARRRGDGHTIRIERGSAHILVGISAMGLGCVKTLSLAASIEWAFAPIANFVAKISARVDFDRFEGPVSRDQRISKPGTQSRTPSPQSPICPRQSA
jgi:hypothetical protein